MDGYFYLSSDATFGNADDISIGLNGYDFTLPAVSYTDVNLSSTGLSYLTVPASTPTGDYYVFVKVQHEPPSVLTDPTPSNNFAMRAGTIHVVNTNTNADLAASNLSFSPSSRL